MQTLQGIQILAPSRKEEKRRGLPYMCQKEVISLLNTYLAAGEAIVEMHRVKS